jgi:asparagine synthase (glutamine-hydrolysing)
LTLLEEATAHHGEPFADGSALPTWLVSRFARQHVTVALTGDGGDESFAGYERYAAFGLAGRIPPVAGRAGARALRTLPHARREPRSALYRAARFLDAAATPPADRYARLTEVFPAPLRRALWGRDGGFRAGAPAGAGIASLQLLDLEGYLPGDLLPKADVASMAHSLELRSPLLDHRVVELGLALPDALKVRGRTGKVALRQAFADLLPPAVAGRAKSGFGVPLGRWFRSDLRELAYDLLPSDRGWFRPEAVRRLLDEHGSGRSDHGHRLWCLLMLELWVREHVEAPVLVPAA